MGDFELPKKLPEGKGNPMQADEKRLKEMLPLNELHYVIPANLSVTDRRHMVRNYFDQSAYLSTQNEMIAKITSSTEYSKGDNAYLVFTLSVSSTVGGGGADSFYLPDDAGALAIFSRILIESKDGSELERIENVNYFARDNLYLNCPHDYIDTVATVAGIRSTMNAQTADVKTSSPYTQTAGDSATGVNLRATATKYIIPMWMLSGYYGKSNTLMPSLLTAGSRIRLSFNSPNLCLIRTDGGTERDTDVYFTVSNPQIVHDNYALSPRIQRALLQQSQNGLEYVYETAFESNQSFTGNSVSHEINKSVARVMSVQWSYQTAPTAFRNNQGTRAFELLKSQVRCGDLYFPQQPLETDSVVNSAEFYYNTMYSCKKAGQCWFPPAIRYLDWSLQGNPTVNSHYAIMEQTMERSDVLELTGLAINNSRSLVINDLLSTDTAKIIRAYLKYIKIAKVFPQNVVVKS